MSEQFWGSFDVSGLPDEGKVLTGLLASAALDDVAANRISEQAAVLVEKIRNSARPGLMESFLAEYGLSTKEGVALMCLAEALLRVPDASTIDALIEDKIAASNWRKHLGHSTSALVNASTWGLMLTGRVLDDADIGLVGTLRGVVKRLGEPVIRTAVAQAMREMGRQFVLGQSIGDALANARTYEEKGFTYSYDMLGEAARTEADAARYYLSYSAAISAIAQRCVERDIAANPGISLKLSALHPRYEVAQANRVRTELVPKVRALALLAKAANMGLNIDAEEADRLHLSMAVVEDVLSDPALKGWDGFGVVVQAYSLRAGPVLDWLYGLAKRLDRRIMVRLVKGAYWDTEIKRAQVLGLRGFPVFTRKPATDVSYIANAAKLLEMRDRIYPQFATHNAHTVAAVMEMAGDSAGFEFQRLHGMGENLHDIVMDTCGSHCRIYAPVGAHRDLLAYLVRRLLENGANSSFVNQIVDENIPADKVAADPFEQVRAHLKCAQNPAIATPVGLFGTGRPNSRGWDLTDKEDLATIESARRPFKGKHFEKNPIIAAELQSAAPVTIVNPFDAADKVGTIVQASPADVETALTNARPWAASAEERAQILGRAADLFEQEFGVFFALLAREAAKTLPDAVSELREAVDFLRYYGVQAQKNTRLPLGRVATIAPWNFPLAIFTGQVAAVLAAGNAVLAKPAEQTPLIAAYAVEMLHRAGVPTTALQMLPGEGAIVGAALSANPAIDGICFTGSTQTARAINTAMAQNLSPHAPLIAETGGLNAMIVDSTALHEQAVRDILASAFQSAGQRCSALRILYVQKEILPDLTKMLFGAMDELRPGNPWDLSTDTGPVIEQAAAKKFAAYIGEAVKEGRLLKQLPATGCANYIPPTVVRVAGIGEMEEEIFGPVLHLASFESQEIGRVVADINASQYGLTFGAHSRIDDRIQSIIDQLHVGNIYVNRNQIGAVVGSQPFGGAGLSGTGPKAGGPAYLARLTKPDCPNVGANTGARANVKEVQEALDCLPATTMAPVSSFDLPGPTGESNILSTHGRGKTLCLGPGLELANEQAGEARAAGCTPLLVCPGGDVEGVLLPRDIEKLRGFSTIVFWGDILNAKAYRVALAALPGPLLPLITERGNVHRYQIERHVCFDTTASGGNADLLAAS